MAEYIDTLRLDHLDTTDTMWAFISDSQDVAAMRSHLPSEALKLSLDLDSFFVRVVNGEYAEVWGIDGTVPYRTKIAMRIL